MNMGTINEANIYSIVVATQNLSLGHEGISVGGMECISPGPDEGIAIPGIRGLQSG